MVGLTLGAVMIQKMLQGIRSCVPSCRVLSQRCAWISSLLTREVATIGDSGSNLDKLCIDQSYQSVHVGDDGTKYQFGTVVKSMKKGQSALPVWEKACFLIASNFPTCAVAFVSKPTESAVLVFDELATQLSKDCFLSSTTSSYDKSVLLDASSLVNIELQNNDGGLDNSPSTAFKLDRADKPPLIGCILNGLEGYINDGVLCRVEKRSQKTQGNPVDGRLASGTERAEGSFSCSRANLDVHPWNVFDLEGDSELEAALRALRTQDEDNDEGTLSDWEGFCSEYAEIETKEICLKDETETPYALDTLAMDYFGDSGEDAQKELVKFLNALTRPVQDGRYVANRGSLLSDSDFCLATVGREIKKATMYDNGSQATDDVSILGPGGFHANRSLSTTGSDFEIGNLLGEGQDSSLVEKCIGSRSTTGLIDLRPEKNTRETEEENYTLVVCVGHMPGAKAVSFHSTSTGLPCLPDLENAITVNNPHMLLLGSPGYAFTEFVERLCTLFPKGCRAGAFLAPLFTGSQLSQISTHRQSSPLFIGGKAASGVVGLSISGQDSSLRVPIDAFAEFIRMSVGMTPIPGFVYIDEHTSKSLFFSRNMGAVLPYQLTSMAPKTVLSQINKHLKHQAVKAVSNQSSEVTNTRQYVGNKTSWESPKLDFSKQISPAMFCREGLVDSSYLARLPIAIMDAVLFPGWSMPFRIFEPCYRLMVRECVELGQPFGLSCLSTSGAYETTGEIVGTIVNLRVHSFEKDYSSYIIAHGVQRFRVIDERMWMKPGSFGLTIGKVQCFDDNDCQTAEEKKELQDLAQQAVLLCAETMSEETVGLIRSAHNPTITSFAIGHILNVPTRIKRRWLKMVDTKTRLLEQMTFLENEEK